MNRVWSRWVICMGSAVMLSWTIGGCVTVESDRPTIQSTRLNHVASPPQKMQSFQKGDYAKLPTLDETATLDEYLAFAALNNPGLEVAFNRWKAALERIPQEKALPDPRFTYRYFIREVETRVGPQKQGVGLSQMFPWFGKLELRGSIAYEAAQVAKQQYENEKLKLFFQVKHAFYEYYYIGRAIDVVQKNLELVEYLESVVRARYKTASTGHPDVIRAQVEVGKLKDQLVSLQDLLVPALANLNSVLNRPTTAALSVPKDIPNEQPVFTDDQILKWLSQDSPLLRAKNHEIERARHALTLAQKNYYPDFTLGMDYTEVGSAKQSSPQGFANPAALRSGYRFASGAGDLIDAYAIGRSFTPGNRPGDSGQDIWMVSLSMNVPIWFGKYAAGEQEARARYLAAISSRNQRQNSLTYEVQRTLYGHRDAERKLALYRDVLIPKAEESIRSTETAFRSGSASFLDLVDAERTLLEFKLSFERALANRAQRLAELEMLVGRSIPRVMDTGDGRPQMVESTVPRHDKTPSASAQAEEGTEKP